MMILKVTKSQGFILSLEDTFLENHKEGEGGKFDHSSPPSRLRDNIYLGEDVVYYVINSFIKESNYCSDVMKKHFNKGLD